MMKRLILCGIIASAVIGFIGMNAIMGSAENVPVFTKDQLQSANVVVSAGDVFVVKAPTSDSLGVDSKQELMLVWDKSNSRYYLFKANVTYPISSGVKVLNR